ncbi:PHD finger protein 20 isoform X2 [Astyanax mexicanus]|nr:PHD finger protein 20 isoform X2 [Astyanax mexicanus]XP_022538373.2 PHD finger protein 20 isoform X2 [Astyanax mexicanus]
MSRTPPAKRGIRFEVGASVEARDSLKNWYAANIEKIDYEDEKVLIHYRQWSHRYDEWFDWTSPYLRPVERVQLRRQGLQEGGPVPGFRVNEKVLASWSDCRFYPAKVLSVNKDASYTVKFYDGVVQTVKEMHVKPFISEKIRQKSSPSDRNGEKPPSPRAEKHSRPLGNPSCRTRRTPPRTPQRDSEDDSEEEEGDSDEGAKEEWSQRKSNTRSIQQIRDVGGAESFLLSEEDEKMEHERVAEYIGQHNYSKAFLKKTSLNGEPDTDTEHNSDSDSAERIENQDEKKEAELSEPSEEGEEHPPQSRTSEGVPVGGIKRRSVREDRASLKKIKTSLGKDGPECPVPSAQICSGDVTLKNGQSEISQTQNTPAKSGKKQGLNPNRFSREPLYRVIKNQPAPVLSLDLDHNPYKCSSPGCSKSFRKAKLLHYHRKYYHGEDRPADEEMSPNTSVLTGVKDQLGPSDNWENPKPRGGVSVPLLNHSASRSPTSSKAEGRSSIHITERRRVSVPPSGGVQEHQIRPSLKEKSRENPPDRTSRRTVEKSPVNTARLNRSKERKSRSFLRIKLKKKKKKKKSKSGSEENVDILGFGLKSKLNLFRSPVFRKNAAEALLSRRGCDQAGRTELDGEDSVSDWSSDSYGWSDETGPDLHIISSRLGRGSVVSAAVGRKVIRCLCKAEDENDFMIQCAECRCWQHGSCMGLLQESAPDRYVCFICQDPPGQNCGQRQSLRYWYDRDWLSSGHMYGLSFLEENYSHQNAGKITATHQLLGDVQHVVEVLSGLQLKISVLQNETHPDLRLWCQPWKQTERCRKNTAHSVASARAKGSVPQDLQRTESEEHLSDIPSSPASFCNSYISSEHCYPKPWVFYPALEERLVVERWTESELEDGLRACKRVLQYEECYREELQSSQTRTNQEKVLDDCTSVVLAGNRDELTGGTQQQQWQINLLEHIESVQEEITHRMDFIEKELDVLESWLDCTGELEPPEPLDRLPELKHSIKQLMGELVKIQQIALACTT